MTKTVNYDRVATAAPINRGAALARDGRGTHWQPAKTILAPGQVHTDAPPPILPWPASSSLSPSIVGQRFNRLTVLGYGGKGANGAKWVVRCDCGRYGHRRMRTLTNPEKADRLMCVECDYLEELKRGNVPP